jgi:low temperature requirement protein LtrA
MIYGFGVALMVAVSGVPASGAPVDNCNFGVDTTLFLTGFLLSRITILVLYGIAMATDINARKQLSYLCIIECVMVIITFGMASMAVNRIHYFSAVIIVEITLQLLYPYLINFINPLIFNFTEKELNFYPKNITAYQTRFQVFIMIVLGEAIIQTLTPYVDEKHPDVSREISYIMTSILLCFLFALLYCDSNLRDDETKHAMSNKRAIFGQIWYWIHIPLAFSMLMAGIAIKIAYYNVEKGTSYEVPDNANELLGTSCGSVQLALAISRLTHKGNSWR